jgi:hypothetical protein
MRFASAVIGSALLLSVGCAPRGPIAGAVVPDGTGGTIAGIVSADKSTALSARKVTAINTTTGERFEASTAVNGGYTLKVPAGTYRLELELRGGETLATQPDPTQVNVGDLDPDRNFVVRVGG